MMFEFEQQDYVCDQCGSNHWHANRFYCNKSKAWLDDEIALWCSDCEAEVSLVPSNEVA